MISSVSQLKGKIRSLSGGDSTKAQTLLRNFMMERFLERIALSTYRNNFILKGGMLVATLVGLDARATMDIDTTVQSLDMTTENAYSVINEIANLDVDDGVQFEIVKFSEIMEEHDYPGTRFTLEARMGRIRQMIKIDVSIGDAITPRAIENLYQLMFEDRSISIWTYNLETLLAEKLETIMARGIANTRMRDFYDIHILINQKPYDIRVMKEAFFATCHNRNTDEIIPSLKNILTEICLDANMEDQWERFKSNSLFVDELSWDDVMKSVIQLSKCIMV